MPGAPCCARCSLSRLPDFLKQKSMLFEAIESRGHKVFFYPKFHCKLNFIEYFWGADINVTRLYLHETVPLALASVSLSSIHKYSLISCKYMDGYRKGLTGNDLDRAVRKYKSHRQVVQSFGEQQTAP